MPEVVPEEPVHVPEEPEVVPEVVPEEPVHVPEEDDASDVDDIESSSTSSLECDEPTNMAAVVAMICPSQKPIHWLHRVNAQRHGHRRV